MYVSIMSEVVNIKKLLYFDVYGINEQRHLFKNPNIYIYKIFKGIPFKGLGSVFLYIEKIINIQNKCCSFELCSSKNPKKCTRINIYWAPKQRITIISEGSCDFAITGINYILKCIKITVIWQYYFRRLLFTVFWPNKCSLGEQNWATTDLQKIQTFMLTCSCCE